MRPAAPVPPADDIAPGVAGGQPEIASLPNLRDLGGHPTVAGRRVRRGLLYRSTDLGQLDGADATAFARLGIRTVYDLRTHGERSHAPDRLPPDTALVVVDVLEGSPGMTPADFGRLFDDPQAAAAALGNGRAATFFVDAYREFVRLASARVAYGRLFRDVAGGGQLPALFHCTTGKDRTGWAAAALLLLLGVPAERVMDDYLLSNRFILASFQPVVDAFVARGGDPDLLLPLVSVRPAYLESALDEVARVHGTIERYFAEGLGLDAATQEVLRASLVEGDEA